MGDDIILNVITTKIQKSKKGLFWDLLLFLFALFFWELLMFLLAILLSMLILILIYNNLDLILERDYELLDKRDLGDIKGDISKDLSRDLKVEEVSVGNESLNKDDCVNKDGSKIGYELLKLELYSVDLGELDEVDELGEKFNLKDDLKDNLKVYWKPILAVVSVVFIVAAIWLVIGLETDLNPTPPPPPTSSIPSGPFSPATLYFVENELRLKALSKD